MRINPRPRPGPRSPVSYLHLQLQLLLILLALSPPSTAQVPDLVDIKAVPSYSTAPACIQSVLTSVIIAQVTAQRCSALATQVPTARCLCDNPTNIVDGGFTLQRAASANAQQTCTAVADAWYTAENVMRQYCSTNLARLQLSSINGATATLGADTPTSTAGTTGNSSPTDSPRTSGNTSSAPTPTTSTSSNPIATGSSDLSSGAKIGIGIGIGAGLLLLAVGFALLRNCLGGHDHDHDQHPPPPSGNGDPFPSQHGPMAHNGYGAQGAGTRGGPQNFGNTGTNVGGNGNHTTSSGNVGGNLGGNMTTNNHHGIVNNFNNIMDGFRHPFSGGANNAAAAPAAAASAGAAGQQTGVTPGSPAGSPAPQEGSGIRGVASPGYGRSPSQSDGQGQGADRVWYHGAGDPSAR